jgi:high-affinity iron transporter
MRIARWAVALASLSVAGALAAPAKPTAPPRTPDLLDAGKAAYTANCAACHGATGEGNGPVAFALNPKPRNFVKDAFKGGDSVEAVFNTITYGLAGTKMVGYPQLPERDRWGLAYYVLAFRAKK